MRLTLLTLIVWFYISIRLILPLPCRAVVRVMLAALLLAAGAKYQWYALLGGAFFAPDLPLPVLLFLEAIYAALLILFVLTVARDLVLLFLWLSRKLGSQWRLPLSTSAQVAGLACVSVFLAVWGVWEAVRVPDTRTVEIHVPGLPAALDGFSLIQLSDLHIGPLQKGGWLRAVVEQANTLHGDAVVITGDFLDGLPHSLRKEMAPLTALEAVHGVYGVTGNHEYYYRAGEWMPILAQLGVDMIRNSHRVIRHNGAELVLVGLNDPVAPRFGDAGPDLDAALNNAPDAVRILLAHQPRGVATHSRAARDGNGVDIQLSGHTHGGLMPGLQFLVAAFNDGFVNGFYDVDGMKLYVHPGTGLWNGFSCRVGVSSEITRLVLRAEAE